MEALIFIKTEEVSTKVVRRERKNAMPAAFFMNQRGNPQNFTIILCFLTYTEQKHPHALRK
jgi:hypothetical protein